MEVSVAAASGLATLRGLPGSREMPGLGTDTLGSIRLVLGVMWFCGGSLVAAGLSPPRRPGGGRMEVWVGIERPLAGPP